MKKLFLLLAIIALLLVSCEQGGVNEPIDDNPTEQPGNDTGNGDEGNEDENGGNNDENEGNEDENKTFITDAEGNIIVEAEGGEVVVAVTTNMEYDVIIPEDAQAWISVADTRAELRMEKLTFTIAENEAEEERSAVVTLLDGENLELQSITFTQKGAIVDSTQAIKFQDENTKLICTLHWDENEDGELSYEEAAKVTDLGTAFKGSSILAFTELEHFTGLEGIADNAFNGCVSLVKITLPEQIASIGSSSFSGCSNLKKIAIPDSVTSIGNKTFYGCSSLTSVTIGNGVTSIGSYAFSGCSSLTSSINIPNGVTSIGEYTFYNCSSLKSVTIGNGVTEIGKSAFCDCSSLTGVTIGSGVTSIGKYAFEGCTGELIVNCNIPSASYYYYEGAFYNSKFTKVTIGDSVTSIGDYAFYQCSSLTSVYYNGDLSDWCNIDFYNGTSNPLRSGAKLYINNTEVTEVTIPSDISEIKDCAFYGYSSLISITIPDSVTSIGGGAFSYCTSLTSVTIGNGVTEIGDSAFDGCDSLTSVTIPDSVTSIGNWAFFSCNSLTSITIPDSVTSIGYRAFNNCDSLTSVTIGNGVTSIGDYAFYGCSSLTSVYCKATTPPTGGDNMFNDNASDRKIYVPTESVDAYKSAEYWSYYKYYIVGYDF